VNDDKYADVDGGIIRIEVDGGIIRIDVDGGIIRIDVDILLIILPTHICDMLWYGFRIS
jgi:hypothetical protein